MDMAVRRHVDQMLRVRSAPTGQRGSCHCPGGMSEGSEVRVPPEKVFDGVIHRMHIANLR